LAFLVLLASAGSAGMSRERLLAYLWPESDTDQGRNSLYQLLFGVRRELGAESITGNGELWLNPDLIESDVAQFQDAIAAGRHIDAVELYRGPFLDGFYLRGLAEFERWTEQERARHATAYGDALEALAANAATAGDAAAAAEWWRRRAVLQPVSARVAKAYAQALAAAGDHSAALRHLSAHAAFVGAELGVAPDPEISALDDRLRQQLTAVASDTAERSAMPEALLTHSNDVASPALRRAIEPRRRTRAVVVSRRLAFLAPLAAALALVSILAVKRIDRYEPNSVLVAPFQNETGDETLYPLSRIAADWVTGGLARTGLLDVVDSRAVSDFLNDSTGRARPALAAAQHASAGTLVDGVIYRRGDSLRALARVVRVADGSVLIELDPVSAPVNDPQRMLEPLRQKVMGAFAALSESRLRQWVRAPSAPPTYASYVEYARGLDGITQRHLDSASVHVMRAVALDASFAQAKSLLLELSDLPAVRGIPSAKAFIDSLEHDMVAARDSLTPYDQAALDAAVAYRHSDWTARLAAAQRMVAIAPQSSNARYTYAHALLANNYFGEAAAQLDQIDVAHSWLAHLEYFWLWKIRARHLAGDYAGALRDAIRAREMYPANFGLCLFVPDQHAAMGHETEMNAAIAGCLAASGPGADDGTLYSVAVELDAHRHEDQARRLWERILAARLAKNPRAPAPEIRARLGRWAEAYAALRPDTIRVSGRGQYGVFAARAGDRITAQRQLDWLTDQSHASRDSDHELWRAAITLALGDRDGAIGLLRQAVSEGMVPAFNLHAHPLFHELDDYQPYRELTKPKTPGS
jgi:DNA-binding SARP family transcriptional activator/TolB-like protein